MKNIIIYPKDIERITGRTDRYGRKLITRIKKHLNKKDHQFITLDEFCDFTGLDINTIKSILK